MNFILSPLMYYFTRHAFLYLITVLSILCLIASLSELVEYSKQMPNLVDNSFYICLKMTLYKLPINIQNLLPYSFYFGSIMSLLKLSKNSELTIARASGLNIWYCCLPHIILAFLIGIFSITVFSSITAALTMQIYLIITPQIIIQYPNTALFIYISVFFLYLIILFLISNSINIFIKTIFYKNRVN